MIVKLLTEHHLELLSLKGGCRGSSESTHVKMPHCWKSHALAQLLDKPCVLFQIPLSKFLLTHNGRVQDKQETLQRIANKVKNFGVTLADEVEGPFKLELDYIALVLDLNHTENFAYEMYRENPAYIGT